MLAMPGLRAFSLAAKRGAEGVSCDADGVFIGGVPLLQSPSAERRYWTARPAAEINEDLTARYRLPIDIASKAGGLALIAAALNRGDLAMALAEGLPTLSINAHVFIYVSAGMDPEDVPDTAMNALLDAVDTAVQPSGADALAGNRQTLGGLVSHCYPLGPVFIDTGDTDGKAVAAIPFQILVP